MKLQRRECVPCHGVDFKLYTLIAALLVLLSQSGFSQSGATISDFEVLKGFKSLKLSWKVSAPEGSKGVLDIYRSNTWGGPYVRIQEIEIGDQRFIDANTKTPFFVDRKLKVRHRYYYKLSLRGTNQELGPLEGLVSGAPPGT